MILQHALGLMTHPDDEWESIEKEHAPPTTVITAYTCILAAIAPLCAYFSTTQIGWRVGDGALIKLSSASAVELCLLTYFAMLIGVFALGWMIDWMAETYGGKHENNAASGIALAAYSSTPIFLAGLALLYPAPWFNLLVFVAAALYSCFLMLDGIPIVMHIEKDRAVFFGGAILAVALVLLVSTRVGSVLIWSVGFAPEFIGG
ncbi:YIP1 family protein [Dasania sp. GY-MA-18]|uniref:Yip1 family protein n=1 Tax=Dasania phycosphaerae TaxID=2950436 RepID=A0A9J6RJS9_9GAMM|nr:MULTISPECIES: Yip1 family protein [Dasania]MCR8922240.1 YIP1 family protein [Dasania sp. GY-MA-18]MCZ0864668.1 Yip1 family protein [Dasania phycosphaerae]MCZ0868396.1 Yip1 family protein [Dasania phycosphaerae]